jgi:hypothetical protein
MGTCNNYGKFGHMKTDGWALEVNKSNRPKGYRGATEQVTTDVATTEDDKIEYVLCGINDDIGTDKFVCVDSDVPLYNMHIGDMYDDLIMPEVKKEYDKIVMDVIKFPGNMKILINPNKWIGDTAATE